MKTKLLLLICYLLSPLAYGQARREIPDSWIEKLQKYDYKTSANDLVSEFQAYIAPDSLVPFEEEAFISPMFVNLDEDKEVELLLFIGDKKGANIVGWYTAHFCILKQIKKKWCIVHFEKMFWEGSMPVVHILNIQSLHKLFYIKKITDSGSGWKENTLFFYKLINGKLQECLKIVDYFRTTVLYFDEHLYSTDIKTYAEGVSSHQCFRYSYMFDKERITLVECDIYAYYAWNEATLKYELTSHSTPRKEVVAYISGKRASDNFLKIFEPELEKLTGKQKEAYQDFLKRHKKD